MAGFFGLFGGNNNQPKDSFYLEADEAKSMGNLDYMRTPKTVKRTFAKTKGSPDHKETIIAISATEKVVLDPKTGLPSGAPAPAAPSSSAAPSGLSSSSSASSTRPASASSSSASGMDMFRSMAKGMKKG